MEMLSTLRKMATHSSILAWEIPWTEEPGRLQNMELQSRTRLRIWAHKKLITEIRIYFNNVVINKLVILQTAIMQIFPV